MSGNLQATYHWHLEPEEQSKVIPSRVSGTLMYIGSTVIFASNDQAAELRDKLTAHLEASMDTGFTPPIEVNHRTGLLSREGKPWPPPAAPIAEPLRERILNLFRTRNGPLYYSDIADDLHEGLEDTVRVCDELEREGIIGVGQVTSGIQAIAEPETADEAALTEKMEIIRADEGPF